MSSYYLSYSSIIMSFLSKRVSTHNSKVHKYLPSLHKSTWSTLESCIRSGMSHFCPWWKRHVHDIFSIVKKTKADRLFNHLNAVDPHTRFTMEFPSNDESIPFSTLHTAISIQDTSPYRCYPDWNLNYSSLPRKQ